MLKAALNVLTRIHSQPGTIKRLGNPDIYSPCRLTPSSYSRFLRGPDSTSIHGREFIIPVDTMLGQYAQTVVFAAEPTAGTFKLSYNGNLTTDIDYDATAEDIQTALRLLAGLSGALVEGTIAGGLTVVFQGFQSTPLIIVPADFGTLVDTDAGEVTITTTQTRQVWDRPIKRGDKVIDNIYGLLTVDEIIEMPDVGGAIMAYRFRCE